MVKIDFHIVYNSKTFNELCDLAKEKGIDAMVVSGIGETVSHKGNGIKIFPAQEVEWTAALEIGTYNSYKDFVNQKSHGYKTEILRGSSLVLLPEDSPLPRKYEPDLYSIFDEVHSKSGIVISLQNDSNYMIPALTRDYKKDYPFDAIRIRPYSKKDVYSLLPFCNFPVFGSRAQSTDELLNNFGYTEINQDIRSQNELIDLVKEKIPTRVMASTKEGVKPISKTVSGQKIYIGRKNINDLLR